MLRRSSRFVLTFAVYLAAAELGVVFSHDSILPLWLAAGVALSAMLFFGAGVWPAVLLADLAGCKLNGVRMPEAIGYVLGDTLEPLLSLYLIREIFRLKGSTESLRETAGLICLGAVVSPAIVGGFWVAYEYWILAADPANALYAWVMWLLRDGTGVVLVVPAVLAWTSRRMPWRRQFDWRARVAVALLLAATWLAFYTDVFAGARAFSFACLVFPFVIWLALRFGPAALATGILLSSAIALTGTIHGHGPFLTGSAEENILLLDTYIAVLALTGVMMNSLMSQQRQAAERLRKSEQQFRAVFEQATAGIIVIDADFGYTLANKGFCDFLGYTESELLRMHLADVLSPEDWAETVKRSKECIRSGQRIVMEKPYRRKDGREVWGHLSGTWILDHNDTPLQGIGIVQDITQQRHAQEALQNSERRYRELIETAGEGICILDQHGLIVHANDSLVKLLNCPIEELIGTPLSRFQAEAAGAANMPGERSGRQDVCFRRSNGTEVWTICSRTRLSDSDGRPAGELLMITDITERKYAQEELAASEQRYRDLFQNANDMIATVDLDGNLTDVNSAFVHLTGYSREELLGTRMQSLFAPECIERLALMQRQDASISGATIELEAITKDGKCLTLEANSRALLRNGQPAGVQSTFRDITQRRFFEQQFRQAQKMEAVGRLAGGVAHDFNNLLTVIRGYSELLAHGDLSDAARSKVQQIVSAADRAASLTRQLLAFSRQQVLQPRTLDANEIIGRLQNLLQRLIGEDIDCVLQLAPDLLRVKVDPTQLEQVLMNLASNARDAMPNGGKLAITTSNAKLSEKFCAHHPGSRPGDYICISVSDTGVGMDKSTLARIFEPFFTTKPPGEGTGLGLSTAYGIVKQSGGFLWAHSAPGEGAVFHMYLPAVVANVERRVESTASIPAPRGSGTVLVVEDEKGLCNLTCEFLSSHGYSVLQANNPAEALAVAANHPGEIRLLVTDVIMPGCSGPELAAQLQASRPQLRILYMSGYVDRAILRSERIGTAAAYLQKPFSLPILAAKVREILEMAPGGPVDLPAQVPPAAKPVQDSAPVR